MPHPLGHGVVGGLQGLVDEVGAAGVDRVHQSARVVAGLRELQRDPGRGEQAIDLPPIQRPSGVDTEGAVMPAAAVVGVHVPRAWAHGQIVEDLDQSKERVLVPALGAQRPQVRQPQPFGKHRGLVDRVVVVHARRGQHAAEVAARV